MLPLPCLDGLFQNGSVSVRNAERVGAPDGKPNTIEGYAFQPDPKVEGQFKVHLSGVLFGAPCKLVGIYNNMLCVCMYKVWVRLAVEPNSKHNPKETNIKICRDSFSRRCI